LPPPAVRRCPCGRRRFPGHVPAVARRDAQVRRPEAVGRWLLGVARRIAQRALAPRRSGASASARPLPGVRRRPHRSRWRELLDVLDEELARLPERYHAPLLLCFPSGCTRDEAACRPAGV
jgi:DNA-directed RNA polymerase specialized sigma24 family protein